MTLPDIALIGRSRTGKDTIANHLMDKYGYVRVAFADSLKDMALSVDPVIPSALGPETYALSYLVDFYGWEHAKDEYPEVRRFLQTLGVAVRNQIGPNTWLNKGIDAVHATDRPVVVTDVRFRNEAKALEALGFMTVSVTRPCRIVEGLDVVDTHVSETELAKYPTDRAICNAGSIADLESDVEKYLLSR